MKNDRLIFKKAANTCIEATPLGNGRIGALVFGDALGERIILNEDTLWSGGYRDTRRKDASVHLSVVRRLLKEGKNGEAHRLIEEHMLGNGYSESYMPMCELNIAFENRTGVEDYVRELSMATGTARVSYSSGGIQFSEKAYVSYPDEVFVWDYRAEAGTVSLTVSCKSLLNYSVRYEKDLLQIEGQCPDNVIPRYVRDAKNPVTYSDFKGLKFCTLIKLITDGEVCQTEEGIRICNATYCTLIGSAHNTYNSKKPYDDCSRDIDKALEKGAALETRHILDFSSIYKRVSVRLQEDYAQEYQVDELLADAYNEKISPRIIEALFQFGRYLCITASRQGQPANLQGIWNWEIRPQWSANWTTNINLQMNYWPIEACNLSDLFPTLSDWIIRNIPSGTKTAEAYYSSKGWCMHHNVDLWGITSPAMDEAHYAMWPMAGVWLCQHLYRHWQYTNDTEYLKKTFLPVAEGAVRFCLDMLVEDENGYLVTSPSTSPENQFYCGDEEKPVAVTQGSASDMTMLSELFENYTAACEAVEIVSPLLKEVSQTRKRLRPLSVDENGVLLEWGRSYREADPGHRHFSPLYGCYPGDAFLDDKRLMDASEKLFTRRIDNNGCIGWSYAWAVCLASRYGKRKLAEELLKKLVSFSFSYNLFSVYTPLEESQCTRHRKLGPCEALKDGFFQIDANFGLTAAVCELLLKCRKNEIEILPCLPDMLAVGEVNGLRVYGDITVDFSWKDGKPERVILHTGERCCDSVVLVCGGVKHKISLLPGKTYSFSF